MKPRIVKIHIDHLANPDGNVWAVRYGKEQFIVHEVEIHIPLHTVFHGVDAKQPKAYLKGHGIVSVEKHYRERLEPWLVAVVTQS